ncbi:MAG: hypothetical protein WBR15_07460 [Gammaproteobacteria bacterium]
MPRRYPLLIVLTLLVLLSCACGIWSQFQPSFNAPFAVTLTDARSVTVQPLSGVPLPSGLRPGDRLDLPAMDFSARYLILPLVNDDALYPGVSHNYQLAVNRGDVRLTVPVTSVDLSVLPSEHFYTRWSAWSFIFNVLVFSVLALILVWRGRERAAAGLALWVIAGGVGIVAGNVHFDGMTGMALVVTSEFLYLLARVGLYLMVDFLVGVSLSPRVLWLWRGSFVLVLVAGFLIQMGGSVFFLIAGWAGLLYPSLQFIWVLSYLIPVAMLFISYRSAPVAERLRLRWMLWSGALWVLAIGIFDIRPFGLLPSNILGNLGQLLAPMGFLYAVLRHRAVDVSVAIDRTLVYGSVTAVVVGILAALNSIVQHAALGTSASLLLQIAVPLALGIVLGQVKNYAGRIVERVFFRKRYLAEKALRRFARHCDGYENSQELLTATAQAIRQKLGVPGVALYLRKDGQYLAAQRAGESVYPDMVKIDDAVFVAARSGLKDIDLSETPGALGSDGHAFPMGAQGVLVCANRPGEHYASDERKLLAYVARQVSAALYSVNMRESLDFVRAVARGVLDPVAAREHAVRLESGWV